MKLNILSWSANFPKVKMGELREFLYESEVDILLIQKTFLKPTDPLKIPNFYVYIVSSGHKPELFSIYIENLPKKIKTTN